MYEIKFGGDMYLNFSDSYRHIPEVISMIMFSAKELGINIHSIDIKHKESIIVKSNDVNITKLNTITCNKIFRLNVHELTLDNFSN